MPKLTNMDRPDYLFLIGGADLEMLTIRQLLTANGFAEGEKMADRHLQWGAKLSDYQDLFNGKQTFVRIELAWTLNPLRTTLMLITTTETVPSDFPWSRGLNLTQSNHYSYL